MTDVGLWMKACKALALPVLLLCTACSMVQPASPAPDRANRRATLDMGLAALEAGEHERGRRLLATVAAICPVDPLGRRASLALTASELDPRGGGRPDVAADLAAFQLTRPGADRWTRSMAEDLYLIALDYGAAPVTPARTPPVSIYWTAYGLADAASADAGAAMPRARGIAAETPSDAERRRAAAARAARPAPDDEPPIDTPPIETVIRTSAGDECEIPAPARRVALPELEREPLAARAGRADRRTAPSATPEDITALQAEVQRLQNELNEKEQELERIRRTLRP